jgi:hypothetical protein
MVKGDLKEKDVKTIQELVVLYIMTQLQSQSAIQELKELSIRDILN